RHEPGRAAGSGQAWCRTCAPPILAVIKELRPLFRLKELRPLFRPALFRLFRPFPPAWQSFPPPDSLCRPSDELIFSPHFFFGQFGQTVVTSPCSIPSSTTSQET